MPELAEVLYYSRRWDAALRKCILRVHVRESARVFRGSDASRLAAALTGTEYLAPATHGKNLLFSFSNKVWLGGHLGMTGELTAEPPDFVPGKHDHLVLFTADCALVVRDPRMFGRWRLDKGECPAWWTSLPHAVMSSGFTSKIVSDHLRRRARTPLKALLLDQSIFPGIGNWMADEILWQLKLPPDIPAGDADPAALTKTVKGVSRTAVRTIGHDWSDPPGTWLFRYRWKAGGLCPRCHTPLTRASLRGRTACWCPHCQASTN